MHITILYVFCVTRLLGGRMKTQYFVEKKGVRKKVKLTLGEVGLRANIGSRI